MSDIAIRVENLGKLYHIGGPQAKYKTIRESIQDGVKAPFRRAGRLFRGQAHGAAELDQTIWALKDVTFEIRHGEALGIIGRNGAGKSTLLKIFSRITEPTTGHVMLRGRVGSLLEVGTGFHPELTGRENVYLNGSILGMKRGEIDKKFDEIIEFSGIERFIDTPVKHYSSGMSVRLAFSVAAHLEPEILLIDEVLAVGDAAFQRKCLGKMGDVADSGRTVIFVSHDMTAIDTLTKQALYLDNGRVQFNGPSPETIKNYTESVASEPSIGNVDLSQINRISTNDEPLIRELRILSFEQTRSSIKVGEPLSLEFTYKTEHAQNNMRIGIGINNLQGLRILSVNSEYDSSSCFSLNGEGIIRCDFGSLPLTPGIYEIVLNIEEPPGVRYEKFPVAARFEVIPTRSYHVDFHTRIQEGVINWKANWLVIDLDKVESKNSTH